MSKIASRYASALYEVTKEKGNSKEVLETLLALKESLEENAQIFEILSTPLISDKDKEEALKQAIGSSLNKELDIFFQLLTKNNRLIDLPMIVTSFQDKASVDMGIMSGTVKSAVELSDNEKNEVKSLIENKLATTVELTYSVEPQMIGGIEARVGSYIFEDSIKSHMQKLNDFITRRVQ